MTELLTVTACVFGLMLVEAWRAAGNERRQRARGAVEPTGDVYGLMRIAYPGIFAAMIVEGLVRGVPSQPLFAAGAVLFAAAKALKWWAIVALGPYWTFRILVVPGATLVQRGPYRFLRHPNYLAVVGEIAGVAMLTGARLSGPCALLLFGTLMLKRIAVENRALGV